MAGWKFISRLHNLCLLFLRKGDWGVSYSGETTSSKSLKVDHRVELPLTEIQNCLQGPPASELQGSDFIKYLGPHTHVHTHTQTNGHFIKCQAPERQSLAARGNTQPICNDWHLHYKRPMRHLQMKNPIWTAADINADIFVTWRASEMLSSNVFCYVWIKPFRIKRLKKTIRYNDWRT